MLIKTVNGFENLLLSLEYAETTVRKKTHFIGLLETTVKDQSVYKIAKQYNYLIDPEDEDSKIVDTGDTLQVTHFKEAFTSLFDEIKKIDLSDKAVRLTVHDFKADTVEVQHILKYVVSHAFKYDLETDLCDIIELSKGHVIDAHVSLIESMRTKND